MQVILIKSDGTPYDGDHPLPVETTVTVGAVTLDPLTAAKDAITVEPGTDPLAIEATALDIRPLTATDIVTVEPGAGPLVVSATALDTRALDATTDAVTVEPGTDPLVANPAPSRSDPEAHRTSITAADKVAAITISAAESATAGSLAASKYYIAVTPWNEQGPSARSNVVEVTPSGPDLSIDVSIPQAAGATWYEIGLCGCADTHWVGTLTESQRATGGNFASAGSFSPDATPGVVNVRVDGAGGHALTAAMYTANNAYRPEVPTPVPCDGFTTAEVTVAITPSSIQAPLVPPTLKLLNYFRTGTAWAADKTGLKELTFLTAAGSPLRQTYPVEVKGADGFVVLLDSIAPGWMATITVELVA